MVKMYKGFSKDMTCRGYRFEEGKTYHEDTAKLCEKAGNHGSAQASDWGSAQAGDGGGAQAGHFGSAQAGNRGSAQAGDGGGAQAGDCGIAQAGNFGIAQAGDFGSAQAGNRGSAQAGDGGSALSFGSAAVGVNGIACARNKWAKVRGGMGALLIAAVESTTSYDIVTWAAGVVDGGKLKPDTWYTVRNGEFVEADE